MVMRGLFLLVGLVVLVGIGAAAVIACNSVLGIDAANPDPNELTCGHYCDLVMANCTGANAEYLTRSDCDQMCPVFDLGMVGNTMTDTLGCRLTHANAAANQPDVECRLAGPLGGGACGDPCESFCSLDTVYCMPPRPVAYDGGIVDCMGACPAYPYLGDAGDTTETAGNTLNCRLYHLESAYASDMASITHCPHTAVVSAVCK
jgi:hypothetical protein